jgi:membrane protein
MAGPVGLLKRSYPVRLAQAYSGGQSSYYAATLAFKAFLSMFPLLLGMLAVVGLVLRNPQLQAQVQAAILGFFPADAQPPLSHTLESVRQKSGILGLIAIVGMLWSGGNLFITLEFVLGRIVGSQPRAFLRQRAMAFMMTAVFVAAIVLAVLVNAAAGLVRSIPFAGPAVGAVVWVAFMLAIYRWVPNRTFRLAEIWRGALLAGVLMEVLTLVWPLYVRLSHGFNSYGATFALFFLLAAWLYFWSQFTLLGAVVNRIHTEAPEAAGLMHQPDRGHVETDETRTVDEKAGRRPAST